MSATHTTFPEVLSKSLMRLSAPAQANTTPAWDSTLVNTRKTPSVIRHIMSLICSYYCTPIEIKRRVTGHSLRIANYLEPESRPKKLNHWSCWARVDTKVSRHYSESTLQRVDTTASRHYSKMILSLSQQYSESFWAWVGTTVNTTAS